MRATIDIGSNSILLLIGTYSSGQFEIIRKEANVTGLGRGIDQTKEFAPAAMEDSFDVLKQYAAFIQEAGLNPEDAIVTATEASRVVFNARTFFAKIKKELGFTIQIITGEGEAYYTSLGVIAGSPDRDFTIMDIGGASTELMLVENRQLENSISLPLGCVRATEWDKQGNLTEKVAEALSKGNLVPYQTTRLVCEAGSMTSLAAVYLKLKEYSDDMVQGLELSFEQFDQFVSMLLKFSPAELLEGYPFLGKRAHVIQAGAMIALEVCRQLGVKELEVSTYGLRYGTMVEGHIQEKYLA